MEQKCFYGTQLAIPEIQKLRHNFLKCQVEVGGRSQCIAELLRMKGFQVATHW